MLLFLLEKYCRYRPSTLHSPYVVDTTVWWAKLATLTNRAPIVHTISYWFRDKKC